MKWNEEMIRAELKRLDEITGLQAGYLPIRIDNDYKDEFVAAYLVRDEKPYGFHFTKDYFEDGRILDSNAYNTIRHEYAHYMDHMLTEGNFCDEDYDAHGEKWQACCEIVDALPFEYYSEEQALLDLFFADPEMTERMLDQLKCDTEDTSAELIGCVSDARK